MKLRIRRKSKKEQTLDALASVAKTWSEWQLGKRAAKTVTSGARKASTVRHASSGTWLKVVGGVALVGGVGAGVARKVKGGGGAEPIYTPPVAVPPTDEPVSPVTPSSPDVGVGVSSSPAAAEAAQPAAPDDATAASGAPADVSKVTIASPGSDAEPADAGEATEAGETEPDTAATPDHDDEPRRTGPLSADEHPGVETAKKPF